MIYETCTSECDDILDIHSGSCTTANTFVRPEGPRESFDTTPEGFILDSSVSDFEISPSPICHICEQPITGIDIVIRNGWTICLPCGDCMTCNEQVTIDEINLCISANLPVQHARCRMKTNPNARIPVDERELALLNQCRLIIVPDVDLSQESNAQRARLNWNMLWESFTIEQKFLHVQMMETVYQSAYLALKKDPSEVKNKLKERDEARTKEAHDKARKERRLELPSERAKQDKQGKFLAGMLASGVTKEQAIEIWKSQGRVWME